jgi:glycosyltransferase involved in cell wall biosynthesis
MKKILIWDISFKLRKRGGPTGYLYYIHEYLKSHPQKEITFLSDLIIGLPKNNMSVPSMYRNKMKDLYNKSIILKYIVDFYRLIIIDFFRREKTVNLKNINLEEYNFIHFHQSVDIHKYWDSVKNHKGKIILTSHCPGSRADETCCTLHLSNYNVFFYRQLKRILLKREISFFKLADYYMFPCVESREAYEKEAIFKEYFNSCNNNFFYVPTSISDIYIDEQHRRKLSDYGIPQDAFVISYFGRHNQVKGYDILKHIAINILNKYNNVYFLIAGIEAPFCRLNHERWIELGYINNTHEILSQVDLYILPNRETYFDLVVLEVLRSGIFLLMSFTGGNRYFSHLPSNEKRGFDFFDISNEIELICKVETLIREKEYNSNYKKIGENNRLLWQNYFTMEKYVQKYISEIQKLNA